MTCFKIVPYENSLAYCHPELVKEWDYEKNIDVTPETIYSCSYKRVHWICKNNPEHKWTANPANRSYGKGCPYCSGKKAAKETCLEIKFPEVSQEWDFEKNQDTPRDVTAYSNRKRHWICSKCGYKWSAVIANRTRGGNTGCPECNKSVSTSFPETAILFDKKRNVERGVE